MSISSCLCRRLKKYDELCVSCEKPLLDSIMFTSVGMQYFSLQECEAPGIRQEERIKRIKNCPM